MSRFQIPDNLKIQVISKAKGNNLKLLSFLLITLGVYLYLRNLIISIIFSFIIFYFISQDNKNFLKYFFIICILIFFIKIFLLSVSLLPLLVGIGGLIFALVFIFKIPFSIAFILLALAGGIGSFFLTIGIAQFSVPLVLILTGVGLYYFQRKRNFFS